jgi:hypothetical protein
MMRDDTMKKTMKANRPTPTPAFTERIGRTLAMLPEKRKAFTVRRFLPASAIVFAAVAVVCLVKANHDVFGNLLTLITGGPSGEDKVNPWNAAASGSKTAAPAGQTPTPSQETNTALETLMPTQDSNSTVLPTPTPSSENAQTTAMPTQEPNSTTLPTPMPSSENAQTTAMPQSPMTTTPPTAQQFIQKINVTCTDNDITETVLEAGTDGFVLHGKIKVGPVPKNVFPAEESYNVTIDGKRNRPSQYSKQENKTSDGYQIITFDMPIIQPFQSKSVKIEITNVLRHFVGGQGQGQEIGNFKLAFDLPVCPTAEVGATCSGDISDDYAVSSIKAYKSQGSIALILALQDDENGTLEAYLDEQDYLSSRPYGHGDYELQNYSFVAYKGLVDSQAIQGLSKQKDSHFMVDNAILNHKEDGTITLCLTIDPKIQIADGFTLVSACRPETISSGAKTTRTVTNYLQISLK